MSCLKRSVVDGVNFQFYPYIINRVVFVEPRSRETPCDAIRKRTRKFFIPPRNDNNNDHNNNNKSLISRVSTKFSLRTEALRAHVYGGENTYAAAHFLRVENDRVIF